MPDYFKISFTLVLFYLPFLFLLLIPNNSYFAHLTKEHIHDEICLRLQRFHNHNHPQRQHPQRFLAETLFRCEPPSTTLAVIKPDGMSHEKEIVDLLLKRGFMIRHDKTVRMSPEQAAEWYLDKHDAPYYPSLVKYLTRSDIRVLQLARIHAVPYLRQLIGPTNPQLAREKFPNTVRALYGTNVQENAIHASDSQESAEREFTVFFGNDAATAGLQNTRHLE